MRYTLRATDHVASGVLAHSPATERQHSLSSHLGKRIHSNSPNADEVNEKAFKRQKIDGLILTSRQKVVAASHTVKTFKANNRPPLGAPIAIVQPPVNGRSQTTNIIGNGLPPRPAGGIPSKSVKDAKKRALRSHDGGSRSRSELSLYFPNWDEFISNEPKDSEPLAAETRLFITEETPKTPAATNTFVPSYSPTKATPAVNTFVEASILNAAAQNTSRLTSSEKIDFGQELRGLPHHLVDPLTPVLFHKAHRRAERQETHFRNIEKERAQHEKVQLERLYDGLRGPDWLRVMGISGVTETERKTWEGKRDWCVREVGALIEKFKWWKEEKRRRKVEKEMSQRDEEEGEEEEEARGEEEEDYDEEDAQSSAAASARTRASAPLDDPAGIHLQSETLSATVRRRRQQLAVVLGPPSAERPFTSFFPKPHLRAAAINGHRRGRSVMAFGHHIPDMAEKEFELPPGMVTEEARRASARSRRRQRRSGRDE